MRVLVTGASGFIGGHVLRLLTAAGNDVVGFDITDLGPVAASGHDEIRLVHGDVTDPVDVYNAIAATNPERIIHLASLLVPDCRANPRRAFEVNVGGTINVLEAAQVTESIGLLPGRQSTSTETVLRMPNISLKRRFASRTPPMQ